MGTTHWESNLQGLNGTEAISNFTTISGTTVSGTDVSATDEVSGARVSATNYVKVGSRYIFSGTVTEASGSVVAAASALVTTASLKGSLFMNATFLWRFTATQTAATVHVT